MAQKASQAKRRESAASKKLREQRDDTTQHIENIDREIHQHQQQVQALSNLRSEMMGRLRFICEQLGEVDPLPQAAAQEQPVEGEGEVAK